MICHCLSTRIRQFFKQDKPQRRSSTRIDIFTEVFKKSAEISQLTDGAFDVTVGPLVRAWGFGPDEQRTVSQAKIDSLLQLVGMEKVELKDGIIRKTDPRISLDFNAIAQGYSVDVDQQVS